jgi:hypothetical protein
MTPPGPASCLIMVLGWPPLAVTTEAVGVGIA